MASARGTALVNRSVPRYDGAGSSASGALLAAVAVAQTVCATASAQGRTAGRCIGMYLLLLEQVSRSRRASRERCSDARARAQRVQVWS